MSDAINLVTLPAGEVPDQFKLETYFDLTAYPFEHSAVFSAGGASNLVAVVRGNGKYIAGWLDENMPKLAARDDVEVLEDAPPKGEPCCGHFKAVIQKGACFHPSHVFGVADGKTPNTIYLGAGARVAGDVYLDKGSIFIGEGTTVERGAAIKGSAIIGKKNEIRMGAYFRGDTLIGNGGTFRGELKNVIMVDKSNFPHPSYVGDSICGYMSHFGNQATTANLGIFEGVRDPDKRKNLRLRVDDKQYDLGSPKLGIIMGDFSQAGCNCVFDPGTFLAPYTIIYQLTRINKGFYGPNVLIKNKPMEHGVVEMTPLDSLD